MTDLKTDAEKAEDIKRWWKENGTSVMLGVALAIGSVFGWQQWQAYKRTQTEKASSLFATQLKRSNTTTASTLKSKFSSSAYASLAALHTAKQASLENNTKKAQSELKWVISHTDDELLKQLATLRLARLTIHTGDLDTAQSYLSDTFAPAYSSLLEELKGDLLLVQKKPAEAAKAYRQAIQLSGSTPPRYLQMKLDNLSNVTTTTNDKATNNTGA